MPACNSGWLIEQLGSGNQREDQQRDEEYRKMVVGRKYSPIESLDILP